MEGEMINLMGACIIVVVSLTYSYLVASRIPKGYMRLISLLPIISIFIFIPLLLSSVLLQFYFGAFIAWFASFKLLLFAFGRDYTLSVNPSMSLTHFILITTLPIKIKQNDNTPRPKSSKEIKINTSSLNPVMWFIMIVMYASYRRYTSVPNPVIIHLLYTSRLFFGIQIHFFLVGAIAKFFLGQELEQQFNEPLLPASLQDFWGRRWNLVVSGVLKSTIHEPTKTLFTPLLGKRWALHPATVVTFVISGLMHELVYFYVGRRKPTWEVTWFFLIHGVCVAIEIEVKKKASKRGWKLHPMIQTVSAFGFLYLTTSWLCFTELIHSGADEREIKEYIALGGYIKHIVYSR